MNRKQGKLRVFFRCFWIFIAMGSTLFSENHLSTINAANLDQENIQVVPLSGLTEDFLEEFFAGKTSNIVLECSKDDVFPLTISLKSEFLSLEGDEIVRPIRILKTCFITCFLKKGNPKFLFSTDMKVWKNFEDFFTGDIGLSICVDENQESMDFHIGLNQRK